MLYFLYHLRTRPTGRVIARSLGFRKWGTKRIAPKQPVDLVLRWGASDDLNAGVEINPAAAIRAAANKWTTLSRLQRAGVSTVPFSRDYADLRQCSYIYGRSSYGQGGRGIGVYESSGMGIMLGGQQHEFYTGGIDVNREYRLHIVGDEVVRVQGKYLDFPEQDASGGRVRNHANGYRFRTPRQRLKPQREEAAVAAVKTLGLDFGAVDLILDYEGNHYVLEVNTGPSCSPMTANAYAQPLARLIAERTNGGYIPEVNASAFDALTEQDNVPLVGGV